MDSCWCWRSDWLLYLDCSAPCCTLNWCCVIMQHTLHHHIDRLIMILQIIICLLLHHLVIEIERKQNLFESLLRSHMTSVLKRIFEYSNIFFRILIFVFDSWTFSESEYYSNIRIFWSEYSEII